jgi:hypothetical protein
MAARFPTSTDYLHRITGIVPGSSDYTCLFWLKIITSPSIAPSYLSPFVTTNGLGTYTQWASIFGTDTNFIAGDVSSGSGDTPFGGNLQQLSEYIPCAYIRQGTTNYFYSNGILRGSTVKDMSATTLSELALGNDTFSDGVCEISYFREYNAALSLTELIAEWNSPVAVSVTNLWSDIPLVSNGNDVSGNNRHLTAVGTPTFVSSAIPVPLNNLTSGTAYDVTGSLPQERVQVVHDAGVTNNPWFKVTAQANQIGAFCWSTPKVNPGDYAQYLIPYEDGVFGGPYLGILSAFNKPFQIPTNIGSAYYFRVVKDNSITNPSPAVIYLSLVNGNSGCYAVGDIFVNDDTNGFPGVVLSGTTDYEVVNYYPNTPAGEAGDVALNGNFLLDDINSNDLKLFAPGAVQLLTLPTYSTFGYTIRRHTPTDSFYVSNVRSSPAAPVTVKKISNVGAIVNTFTTTGYNRIDALAVNNAETIMYHTDNGVGGSIYKWDLVGNTDLGVFVGPNGSLRIRDILVLADNSVVVMYYKTTATQHFEVVRYNAAGTLLNTYNLDSYILIGSISFSPRLAYALDDPNSFWVYVQKSNLGSGYGKFLNIKASNGAILVNRNHATYEFGIWAALTGINNPPRAGASESCPFFILPTTCGLSPTVNSLQVIKVTVPTSSTESFDFNTTGGLTPSTFQLQNGQNQSYPSLANGTYGVSENAKDGWTLSYAVSNGDPHDAIVLSGGDNVIVTVTNTKNPNQYSGIYKIVPEKRQDTLWVTFDPEETIDVKIPDPFGKTGLLGE